MTRLRDKQQTREAGHLRAESNHRTFAAWAKTTISCNSCSIDNVELAKRTRREVQASATWCSQMHFLQRQWFLLRRSKPMRSGSAHAPAELVSMRDEPCSLSVFCGGSASRVVCERLGSTR